MSGSEQRDEEQMWDFDIQQRCHEDSWGKRDDSINEAKKLFIHMKHQMGLYKLQKN